MEFKVGQQVRIKKDLIEAVSYNSYMISIGMEEYEGKLATITKVFKYQGELYYRLNVNNKPNDWNWTHSMLTPASKSWKEKYSTMPQ